MTEYWSNCEQATAEWGREHAKYTVFLKMNYHLNGEKLVIQITDLYRCWRGTPYFFFFCCFFFVLPRTSFMPMSGNENSPQERMGGLTEVKTCLHGVCLWASRRTDFHTTLLSVRSEITTGCVGYAFQCFYHVTPKHLWSHNTVSLIQPASSLILSFFIFMRQRKILSLNRNSPILIETANYDMLHAF